MVLILAPLMEYLIEHLAKHEHWSNHELTLLSIITRSKIFSGDGHRWGVGGYRTRESDHGDIAAQTARFSWWDEASRTLAGFFR